MNAPLLPHFLLRRRDEQASDLPLSSAGSARYVWPSRYGTMLIEVRGGSIFVNGEIVEPALGVAPTDWPR